MNPHSILAITDFSELGNHALERAAQLSAVHGASLRLLHICLPGSHAPHDAACRLAHHAVQLGRRHGIRVRPAPGTARCVDGVLSEARRADLLVWGAAPATGLRSFFTGLPVVELLRKARRPLIVVRRAASAAYRSVLVAVDLTAASGALVALACRLGTSAPVQLFHAIGTAHEGRLRFAQASEEAIAAYREARRREALDRLLTLTGSRDGRRNRLLSAMGRGDPVAQIVVQQQRSGAELIVVGKPPASRLTDWLCASTAQQLLCCARTDVLVVPHGHTSPSRARAASRLATHAPEVRRVRAGMPQPPGGPHPAAITQPQGRRSHTPCPLAGTAGAT